MRNSLSKAPSKATIFWMSALFEVSEMSSSKLSVLLSETPYKGGMWQRTVTDDISLVIEDRKPLFVILGLLPLA